MDGSLNLIGHNGLLRFSVPAHSKPISILCCHGDKVVTGGYDGVVMVHRLSDMACVNSVFVYKGHITALAVVEVGLHLLCTVYSCNLWQGIKFGSLVVYLYECQIN